MDLVQLEQTILSNQKDGSFAVELNEWVRTPESLNHSIELIRNSKHDYVVFAGTVCLRTKLKELLETLDAETIENIFSFLIEKLTSPELYNNEKTTLQILNSLAVIASGQLDYMDQLSFLPKVYQIPFFQFCFELLENPNYFNYNNLSAKLETMVGYFIELLEGAPVTVEWFRFHTSVMQHTTFDMFSGIFPRVVEAAKDPHFYPSIADIFEYIVQNVSYTNLQSEEISYVENLLLLVFDIADQNVADNPKNDAFSFSAHIYEQSLDYLPDFYAIPEHLEFTTAFFGRVLNLLQKLIIPGLEGELFTLLEFISEFICCSIIHFQNLYQGFISQPFQDLITQTLTFMIELVNTGEERFLTPAFERIFFLITKEEYSLFMKFFYMHLNDPSPGVFYAIANSSEAVRRMFSTTASQKLVSLDPPPFTIVYFCRTCTLYASECAAVLLEKMFLYSEALPLQVAITCAAVARNFWREFAVNADKLISPMLAMFSDCTAAVSCQLLKALFSIFPNVEPTENVVQVMGVLETALESALKIELENDNYEQNLDFICTIIEGVPKIQINDWYKEYFYNIFDQIYPLLTEYFSEMDPNVQSPLARFMGKALGHNWCNPEVYGEAILQWLHEVIPDNLTTEHFRVLLYVTKFADPEFIDFCLNKILESLQKDNIKDSIEFCLKLVKLNPDYLQIVLNYILPIITNEPQELILVKAISILGDIIMVKDIDLSEFAASIITNVIAASFSAVVSTTDQASITLTIFTCVMILLRLGKYIPKQDIATEIVVAAGNTPEANEFAEIFLKVDEIKQLEEPAYKMYGAYKRLMQESM